MTTWETRKALATEYSIPMNIKRSGRWLALRAVTGNVVTYTAPRKEMRTAFRIHRALMTELTLEEARLEA